jgi:putative membrane protein
MNTLLHWVIAAIAIGIAAYLIPGASVTLVGALVLAVILALLNLLIRPIIFVLTLPINFVTLGLFSLVINAFLVWLAAYIVPGFSVSGFWSAFFFAIVLALVNMVFGSKFLRGRSE